jgi:AAA domain, putative AbiEii toxin, Type IV TA system
MFLRELRISNVRSLKDIHIDFSDADGKARKWTMILGENGCGKSSVLRATALLLAGSDALAGIVGQPDSWIRNGQKSAIIEGRIETQAGEVRQARLEFRRGENIRLFFQRNAKTLTDLDRALAHNAANYFTAGYGAARRINLTAKEKSQSSSLVSGPRADAVATLFNSDAQLASVEAWAFDIHYRGNQAGLKVVERTLSRLLPGVLFKGIDRKNRELIFETADGRVPLAHLSDGYQNMTGWCGDLLYRITEAYGHYRDPLAVRGLLLMDEIDLHLHPVWQRELRTFIETKLPNFQIICTTHSPLTAQQSAAGELFFLRRKTRPAAVEIHQYEDAPRELMVHQVLLGPVFGLHTMDSKMVEDMKAEYKSLAAKASLSSRERKRHSELRRVLSDMPDWSTETPMDRKRLRLLDKLDKQLGYGNGDMRKLRSTAAAAGRRTTKGRKPTASRRTS